MSSLSKFIGGAGLAGAAVYTDMAQNKDRDQYQQARDERLQKWRDANLDKDRATHLEERTADLAAGAEEGRLNAEQRKADTAARVREAELAAQDRAGQRGIVEQRMKAAETDAKAARDLAEMKVADYKRLRELGGLIRAEADPAKKQALKDEQTDLKSLMGGAGDRTQLYKEPGGEFGQSVDAGLVNMRTGERFPFAKGADVPAPVETTGGQAPAGQPAARNVAAIIEAIKKNEGVDLSNDPAFATLAQTGSKEAIQAYINKAKASGKAQP